jgi:hypothetical protein
MKVIHPLKKSRKRSLFSCLIFLPVLLSVSAIPGFRYHAPDVEYSGINGVCVETGSSVENLDARMITDSLIIYVSIGDIQTKYWAHQESDPNDTEYLKYSLKDANKKKAELEIKDKAIVLAFSTSTAGTFDTHFKWETQ